MFDIQEHQHNYFYNLATVIDDLIPVEICDNLADRANTAIALGLVDHVNHSGLGNDAVSDHGGVYNHHIFKGPDIRAHLPELNAIYHAIAPLISLISCTDSIVSPYPISDINLSLIHI